MKQDIKNKKIVFILEQNHLQTDTHEQIKF